MKVGILSFQGSFLDHSKSINELGHDSLLIKQSKDLDSIDALILPGGESTAMKKINEFSDLLSELDQIKRWYTYFKYLCWNNPFSKRSNWWRSCYSKYRY